MATYWLIRTSRRFLNPSITSSSSVVSLSHSVALSSSSTATAKSPGLDNQFIWVSHWFHCYGFTSGSFKFSQEKHVPFSNYRLSVAWISTSPSGLSDTPSKGENQNNGNDGNTNIPSWIDLYLPTSIQPYAKLARLDKPIGTWLLAWPCMW